MNMTYRIDYECDRHYETVFIHHCHCMRDARIKFRKRLFAREYLILSIKRVY